MVHYRRLKIKGGIYFFTVTLHDRQSKILVEHIDLLIHAAQQTRAHMPYITKAFVILPDHIHAIWKLPDNDDNFSSRWTKIKSYFTRGIIKRGIQLQKNHRDEYQLWQNRFWEHVIRNEKDFENHVNYIHYNPVKHRLVKRVRDWPYSSFHGYVRSGKLLPTWSDGSAKRFENLMNLE